MMQIFDCEQGSLDWFRARMMVPTASMFSTVMAKGKGGGESKTRKTYLYKLAGEIISGEPMENYSNVHMDRGKQMEDEARQSYALVHDVEPQRVGFIRNGDKGCSPDSLIGGRGMLEIKTALPHILVEHILHGEFPADHKAQCQGNLWVAEREWIDINIFWPSMPTFVRRARRDDVYIAGLDRAVTEFNEELAEIVAKLRRIYEPQQMAV